MVEKGRRNENGVIISIYVESRILRSNKKNDKIKRINPVRISWQPQCYDRRTQLLAYAQELKHADAKPQVKNSRPKSKRRWAVVRERIRRLFCGLRRVKRLWKYESVDGEGRWSCGRRKSFHFCKKFKCLFKKMSAVWKCKNAPTH